MIFLVEDQALRLGGTTKIYKQGGEIIQSKEIKTKVEIADKTGHTVLQLTKAETIVRAAESEGSWIFAGNQMVEAEYLAEANWDTVGTIRIVPGLVGGQ